MSFKEWWTGRRDVPPPEPIEETKAVGLQGKEVHVNPSARLSAKRLDARLARVKKLLATKYKHGHPRYDEFMRIKNRLVLQKKLREGDY